MNLFARMMIRNEVRNSAEKGVRDEETHTEEARIQQTQRIG